MYEQTHVCLKGCVLFRKKYTEAKYRLKCKSSRFIEVESGDGQKRQLKILVTILRHLQFILKCHWFDAEVTRWTHSNLGLIEIR